MRDILVAQFADGAVGEKIESLLDEGLVGEVAGDEQVNVLDGSDEAKAVDGEPPITT